LQNDAKWTVDISIYHQCLHTVFRRIKNPYRTTMGQERLYSVSTLHWGRHASLSWLWRRDQRFCINKVKEKNFLNCALHCTSMQQECKRDLSLWISKQYRRLARCTCSFAVKQKAVHIGWETRPYGTRPRHLILSPKRDRDRDLPTFPRDRVVWKLHLKTVSRPRRRDRTKLHPCVKHLSVHVIQTLRTRDTSAELSIRYIGTGWHRWYWSV